MFCDRCGASVEASQRFCAQCGRQFSGPVAYMPARRSRVQEHIRLLGILWLAYSALNAVGGVVLYIVGAAFFPHIHELGPMPPNVPFGFLSSLLTVIAVAILVKGGLGLLAGWGLLRHESWARLLTLVLSFLALFNVPFGTALGIYSLWVLLPAESEREYQIVAQRAGAA